MNKIKLIANYGAKNFGKVLKKKGIHNYKELKKEYRRRFLEYIYAEDWGENNFRLTSYLNMFIGITGCKITMEQGYSLEESIRIFDDLSMGMRKFSKRLYLFFDLFSNGFRIIANSVYKDFLSEKKGCWTIEVTECDENRFAYRIHQCLYLDTCEKYGIRDFCQVFCNHDNWAYGSLKKSTRFIRHSTLVEADCCYDEFVNVKREKDFYGIK